MPLLTGLLFGLAALLGVLLGALLVLGVSRAHQAVTHVLLAFAAGTLLGASLLGLIPEAEEGLPLQTVTALALLSVLLFFVLERFVLRQFHHRDSELARSPAGYLILIGDGIHNAADGLVLGAALVADPTLGLMAGVAILAHEVPQEVGDFVLLLESGLSKARALAYNLLSAATIFPGLLLGYLLAETVESAVVVVLALTAGAFLYIALADLIPHLHRQQAHWRQILFAQLLPMLAGVALIWLLGQLHLEG